MRTQAAYAPAGRHHESLKTQASMSEHEHGQLSRLSGLQVLVKSEKQGSGCAIGEQYATRESNKGVSLTVYLMKRQSAPPMTRGILTSARMRSHCVASLLPERTKACDSRHCACAYRLMSYATCHQMPWLLAMILLGNYQTLALMTGRIFTLAVWYTPVGDARQRTMSVLCTHAGVSASEDRICRASDISQCQHRQ